MMQCDPLEIGQDDIIPWHTEKHVEQGKGRHCPFPMAPREPCCVAGLALQLDKGHGKLAAPKAEYLPDSRQGRVTGEMLQGLLQLRQT